ncbi:metallophosphoesterase family protein [Rhizobium rhizogenes]|uniref:metallophosphoesterase family protein n=1 Tax=Rhizobium rhizogenes TaxID=359 RepID=UPI0004DAA292|nr:metallophosphoesterase [Rhizobium rhizogenes]KEA04305.1 metallophosphoesterase [Rhizobium rhizogenes]MQB34699.1 metallophosphoesterase [Rhizobium rhizogenes]NTI82031.1 metallophosphoesterase [Rhizobium rhizogenes]NTJ24213.1 metallophosphoesterase [Rhizobium rhizogenes]QUE79146.1 metallophosphoesterase [Rhizobium rhizogenes]
MKIIQITDTHLSPNKPHFNGNWEPLARWIEAAGADLVIHTGDLSVDGADKDEDLTFSMDLMRQVSVPMLIVPGNHDVGHLPGSYQPVNPERLARWRRLVGPDYWAKDVDNWRLIGLNSLLMGFEDAEEQKQFDWLQETLESRGNRRVALFAHKPLFVDAPNEGDTGYWSVRPAQRRRLYDLISAHDVALLGSGHLHWTWEGRFNDTALVWAPPAAFILDTMEREMPGERLIGAAIHELGDDVTTEIVAVPGMTAYFLDDVVMEVYPQAAPKAQKEPTE